MPPIQRLTDFPEVHRQLFRQLLRSPVSKDAPVTEVFPLTQNGLAVAEKLSHNRVGRILKSAASLGQFRQANRDPFFRTPFLAPDLPPLADYRVEGRPVRADVTDGIMTVLVRDCEIGKFH
jgi:hypothetical protein